MSVGNESHGTAPGLQPLSLWYLAVGILVVMTVFGCKEFRHYLFLDNFGVVVEGEVYRSGQLTAPQLERVIRQYALRTVINTREEGARVGVEAKACREHNVQMVRIAMPSKSSGERIALLALQTCQPSGTIASGCRPRSRYPQPMPG